MSLITTDTPSRTHTHTDTHSLMHQLKLKHTSAQFEKPYRLNIWHFDKLLNRFINRIYEYKNKCMHTSIRACMIHGGRIIYNKRAKFNLSVKKVQHKESFYHWHKTNYLKKISNNVIFVGPSTISGKTDNGCWIWSPFLPPRVYEEF